MGEIKKVAMIEPVGNHGGAHYYDYALCDGLAKNGLEVHFFTSTSTEEMKFDGVTTHFTFGDLWQQKGKIKRFRQYVSGLIKAYKICKKNKVPLVHYQVYHLNWLFFITYTLARWYKLKVVTAIHDVDSFSHDNLPANIEKKIVYGIDKIIVHNNFCFKQIHEKYPRREYNVVFHGNYLPFVTRVSPQHFEKDCFKILFFGQIKKVKGLDVLLKAMGVIKSMHLPFQVKLKVVGKVWKDELDTYTSIIKEAGIEDMIELKLGYIHDNELGGLFEETNLIVLPYKHIYQSGVLIMGMSYGRALITSDLEPFKEIVEDGVNGYMFKSEDHNDLAEKLVAIYNNRETLSTIEENAYKTMQTAYDWYSIASQTKKLYETI